MGERSRERKARHAARAAEEAANRTPPAAVRRLLRRDVGFVCPVEGCESPYLGYHHFDPPWHVRQHHDVAGMIALCLQHHREADSGAFTLAQLRALKSRRNSGAPSGRFNWRRERTVFQGGGVIAYCCPVILQVHGRNLVWMTRSSDGHELLNVDLFSASGQPVFSLRDNEWLVTPGVDDIEAPPSARTLKVRSAAHDVSLDLEFRDTSVEELRTMGLGTELLRTPPGASGADDPLLLCTMHGRVKWPVDLHLAPAHAELAARTKLPGAAMTGCVIAHCAVGIGIG